MFGPGNAVIYPPHFFSFFLLLSSHGPVDSTVEDCVQALSYLRHMSDSFFSHRSFSFVLQDLWPAFPFGLDLGYCLASALVFWIAFLGMIQLEFSAR